MLFDFCKYSLNSKNGYIHKKVVTPSICREQQYYKQNSLFTLCTVLTLTLDSFAVLRTE